jgi:hypothetical protein
MAKPSQTKTFKGVKDLILDNTGLLLLRLAGAYRWLPSGSLGTLRLHEMTAEAEKLIALKLITQSRSGKYLMLTTRGYDFLDEHGWHYERTTKRAYENSTSLHRRLEVCSVMLTALRAGIDTLCDGAYALRSQPVFRPAFALRTGGVNLMNAASCIGFGHWGNTAYMLQYCGKDSKGMYFANELSQLHRLAPVFDESLSTSTATAMILAGGSYAEVYDRVHARVLPKTDSIRGYADYYDAYRLCELPVHLLSCDETGAMQLAVMSEPGYRGKIAFAAFGDKWYRHDKDIPFADGCVDGCPLVIAVDMDVRRVMGVISEAHNLGRREVMLAALHRQMRDFYLSVIPKDKGVTPLIIRESLLYTAFGRCVSLYSPDASSPALSQDGGVIQL